MLLKLCDELRSEGDFWHKDDDGFLLRHNMLGVGNVNSGFAAAGNAVQQDCSICTLRERINGGLLIFVE